MANIFHSGKMVSDQLDAALTSAVFEAPVLDGSIAKLGDLVARTTYVATGDYEYDLYEAAAPTAVADEVVIVDYAGIAEGEIAGNVYKMGINLYNLTVPAGVPTRVRRLYLHDKFWLGDANFASAPTVGQFAGTTANSGLLTPAASAAENGLAVKILVAEDLTTGMASNGKKYLCEVVSL